MREIPALILLKLFIKSNEQMYTTDAQSTRAELYFQAKNIQSMIAEDQQKTTQRRLSFNAKSGIMHFPELELFLFILPLLAIYFPISSLSRFCLYSRSLAPSASIQITFKKILSVKLFFV